MLKAVIKVPQSRFVGLSISVNSLECPFARSLLVVTSFSNFNKTLITRTLLCTMTLDKPLKEASLNRFEKDVHLLQICFI